MNNHDRKDLPINPAQPTPLETPADRQKRKAHESELLDEAIQETFPASDSVSPFVPAPGLVQDTGDVESTAGSDAGIEQAGHTAPEQIDAGAEGKLEI